MQPHPQPVGLRLAQPSVLPQSPSHTQDPCCCAACSTLQGASSLRPLHSGCLLAPGIGGRPSELLPWACWVPGGRAAEASSGLPCGLFLTNRGWIPSQGAGKALRHGAPQGFPNRSLWSAEPPFPGGRGQQGHGKGQPASGWTWPPLGLGRTELPNISSLLLSLRGTCLTSCA